MNRNFITLSVISLILGICGICAPLMAQDAGSWELVKLYGSAAGYANQRVGKEFPTDSKVPREISWQYNESGGVRKVDLKVAFTNVKEIIPSDVAVIGLGALATAGLSGPAREGRNYVHFKCDGFLRTTSGFEDNGFPQSLDHRVDSGTTKDFSCGPAVPNSIPKEDFMLELKIMFDDSGFRFKNELRADSGDATFQFYYKWRPAARVAPRKTRP